MGSINRFWNEKKYTPFRQQFQGQGRQSKRHWGRRYPICSPLYTTAWGPSLAAGSHSVQGLRKLEDLENITHAQQHGLQMAKGSRQNKSPILVISEFPCGAELPIDYSDPGLRTYPFLSYFPIPLLVLGSPQIIVPKSPSGRNQIKPVLYIKTRGSMKQVTSWEYVWIVVKEEYWACTKKNRFKFLVWGARWSLKCKNKT